jgi:predicted nuclease of predicted toxin-antitoxin system
MRFLANENVEQPVVGWLRGAGHDVTHVSDVAPGATDQEILLLANREDRLLLTNDKDFGEMAYRENRASAGILLLRLEAQDGAEKAARLSRILPLIENRLVGHFAVVTEARVRVRPLRHL